MDEINLVFGVIQTAAIVAGVILAIAELRHMRLQRKLELETRQIQLVNELSQVVMSLEGQRMNHEFLGMEWKDYDDFEQKYGSDNNPENAAMRNVIGNWYNFLGILMRYRIAEAELIFDWTGWNVIWGWNKFRDIWLKQRELYNMPERHKNWELLYYEMKRIAESRGYSTESSMTPARYTDEMRRKVRNEGT